MTLPFDEQHELSSADRKLLDALVEAEFDASALGALSAQDRKRVDALLNLCGLLEDYPVEDADAALVDATLARIARHEQHIAGRMKLDVPADAANTRGGALRRIRLPDFITVAAVLLIGAAVVWPIASTMRNRAIDSTCANNMRALGNAFTQYANDYNGALPMRVAAKSWDNFYNFVNLDPLKDNGYCEDGHLNCPGHHVHSGPSYSYQLQTPGAQAGWGVGAITAIFGDRNPIIDAARNGEVVPPLSISANHGERGQNVLFGDGSARWLAQPTVGDDNIWLPEGCNELRKGAMPHGPRDAFLTH